MSQPPPPASTDVFTGRRYDLDWIRVGAFMLLILYHIGMFYVPWDWHVNSPRPVEALEPVMHLTNPWRLTLLFLVSGAALRFMADSFVARGKSGWAVAGSRTLRLLPPILFGMFVIVPPQSYYEVLEAAKGLGMVDPAHGVVLQNFWLRYATASGHWCDPDGCLVTPTWNHLWFIVYLLPYSLLLILATAIPGVARTLQNAADRAFGGWGLALWPALYLVLIRCLLAPRFEITHALVDDWYNHALSFGAFTFGYLTARSEPVRWGLIRLRWPALIVALCCWGGYAVYAWIYRGDAEPAVGLRRAIRVIYGLDQAAFMAAVLGFGARWLNRDAPVLRYLTVGVFPFYIVHQTVIVVAAHNLAKVGLPRGLEAALLVVVTVLGCLVAYEAARRIGWFGLLLGVSPRRARSRP